MYALNYVCPRCNMFMLAKCCALPVEGYRSTLDRPDTYSKRHMTNKTCGATQFITNMKCKLCIATGARDYASASDISHDQRFLF
jgi:hypothetical protein